MEIYVFISTAIKLERDCYKGLTSSEVVSFIFNTTKEIKFLLFIIKDKEDFNILEIIRLLDEFEK